MPSPSERRRNNVRAGVFVTVTLLLGLVVIGALTHVIENFSHASTKYDVVFDVASGVSNLKSGADVRVGGVRLGRVTRVMPRVDPGSPFREIVVSFKLDKRVQLYDDAVIVIAASLIGSDAWIDIPSVGLSGRPPGATIRGTPSSGALTTFLGPEGAADARRIVRNVREFSEFFPTVKDDYAKRIVPTLDNVEAASADVKTMIADFRQKRYAGWADAVDKIMAWAVEETKRIDEGVAEAKGLLADARSVVAENRQAVKAAADNVRSVTEKVNTQTIDKVHALLDSGQEGLDEATRALENFRVDYAAWATDIGEALGNANLAAQQLKLTMIETRRSPWKVLYRPSSTELEHELLYEATRSFAVAAADLKAASESVERVLAEHPGEVASDEEAFKRLKKNLLDSLAGYEKAQQQLLDVLVAEPAK